MVEGFTIPTSELKQGRYDALIPQIKALISEEKDLIANLANIASALKYGMRFFWVGFYLEKHGELVLGPFQGPVACTRIPIGKGVCGQAFDRNEIIVVEDVEQFPGHIACSSESKSEIVLPVAKNGKVAMVLDVDSDELGAFDEIDTKHLSVIADLIEEML